MINLKHIIIKNKLSIKLFYDFFIKSKDLLDVKLIKKFESFLTDIFIKYSTENEKKEMFPKLF